jgi:biopolymer transport protein ExbB
VALFVSKDGATIGTAEQRLGSLEPAVIPFEKPEDVEAARIVLAGTSGLLPFDPTLGSAHKIEATQETLSEHVRKGGPVMIPIFALAGLTFLVASFKWLSMVHLRAPAPKRVRAFLDSVIERDPVGAKQKANAIGGPVGMMLSTGVDHLDEPRELIEEVLYEKVLETRLSLDRYLPFIAISAAAAPLLGLLGTVTGIINTFKLITVFGSGDVKTLSGGISEALITTEFGLIVAIPSLLLHAFLSRKARAVTGHMEKTAVAFANQVSKSSLHRKRPMDAAAGIPLSPPREITRPLRHEPQPAAEMIN